jgi:signal transduction histidine kinase
MSALRGKTVLWIISIAFVGCYAGVSLVARPGLRLTEFSDIALCLVLLFTNAGLLSNAASPDWRRNGFWMLLATGCGMWLLGQLLWTYFEVHHQQSLQDPFLGDIVFFLHTVPLLGALALRPHETRADHNLRFRHVDFLLLFSWWVYLYMFVVIPWQYVVTDADQYAISYSRLYGVENATLVCALAYLVVRTPGAWKKVYAHLLGAASLFGLGAVLTFRAIDQGNYYPGGIHDVPLVASFVWFGVAGLIAGRICPPAGTTPAEPDAASAEMPSENKWPARLARTAALSLPALAIWSQFVSTAPPDVQRFRLIASLIGMTVLTSLVFLRHRLVDKDRLRLLWESKAALANLKRIQSQFIQAEKLASLGQLVAGAAHEINNPLAAILGYSEVLAGENATPERSRAVAEKILAQARRTKEVVSKLLSFANPQPADRTLVDINSIIASAVELRRLDLLDKKIRIEVESETHLPGVRGDASQLLQVFFNIISNAVDAMDEVGGGILTVRTARDHANVVIEFSDTGPGVHDPEAVFDPFYTTKPVGKGTGLGLSICYGLVKEHKGKITCFNRAEGGATFRIELPALLALFPTRDSSTPHSAVSARLT